MDLRDRRDDDYWWETVDIRPVPPGWRIVRIAGERLAAGIRVSPMAGWLIQERQPYVESDLDGRPRHPNAERRVIAGEPTVGGHVDPVDFDPAFWRILAPDQPEPTAKDIENEVARRARVAANKAKRDQP